MRTLIPRHSEDVGPEDGREQDILEMHMKLDNLTDLTGLSPPMLEEVEDLWAKIK